MKFRSFLAPFFLTVFASASLFAEEPAASPAASPTETAAGKADFGDFSSSTITTKAWKASAANDPELTKTYARKCIDMFEKQAIEMQAGIKEPVDTKDKEAVFANWALNDVGTCYFILGQTLEKAGDKKGALDAYKILSEKLSGARCWDEKGWFWKPADAAKGKLKALEFDAVG